MPLTTPFTVGFDLDMTLIDSRPGIAAAFRALSEETGTPIDTDLVVSRLGPPLEEEIVQWFPPELVTATAARYRELYPDFAIEGTTAMPGAHEAIASVHRHGGRVVVVTAKYQPNAKLHLDHLGLGADAVVGSLWARQKAEALKDHGASVYVGDHVGDVRGARAAGAFSVAVPTGPCDAAQLLAEGADVILDDLTRFSDWLDGYAA